MFNAIAVISDIHSNKLALEAVLRDISQRNVDLIVNLGDSLFGPVDPLGTARLLMERADIVNIMGNCDEVLLQETLDSLTFRYVKPLLGAAEEDWIIGGAALSPCDGIGVAPCQLLCVPQN